jgi:protease I
MNSTNKKVLFILPHTDFRDKEYSWTVERLDLAGISHEVASSHQSEAQGRFGTVVLPDTTINFVTGKDYDAFIFVGGIGAKEYYGDSSVIRIITNAFEDHKVVAAIGLAVPILSYGGLLAGKRVTGPTYIQADVEEAGAYYTGGLIVQDGNLITANGPYATRELAESVVKALECSDESPGLGRKYLR